MVSETTIKFDDFRGLMSNRGRNIRELITMVEDGLNELLHAQNLPRDYFMAESIKLRLNMIYEESTDVKIYSADVFSGRKPKPPQ